MRFAQPDRVSCRAIVGLIALYALLLQAIAGPALPTAPASLSGLLCQHEDAGAPAGDLPVHADHQCCLAACMAAVALPPPGVAFGPTAWPLRPSVRLFFRHRDGAPPTGPPHSAWSARGPPLA